MLREIEYHSSGHTDRFSVSVIYRVVALSCTTDDVHVFSTLEIFIVLYHKIYLLKLVTLFCEDIILCSNSYPLHEEIGQL